MGDAPRARVARRPVHGVLLLDKPIGLSSNQALQRAKWLLRAEKAGHTGTLDPLATGVLPLCFGAATKFSQMHLEADKAYETVLRLGVKTTTADAEGDVIVERTVQVCAEQLDEVVRRFTGPIQQIPPMHSALKKDGKALYEYARAGIEIERAPRDVTIHALKVLEARIDSAQPAIKMVVECSKGTYIRTLGEDMGEALGCGAHLSALRRIRTGNFDTTQCITLEALEAMSEDQRLACLLPVDALLPGHSVVTLDSEDAGRFLSGMRRRGLWPDADAVAVYVAGTPGAGPPQTGEGPHGGQRPAGAVERGGHVHLLGTAHVKAGELIPVRLLSPLEISESLAQQQSIEQIIEKLALEALVESEP